MATRLLDVETLEGDLLAEVFAPVRQRRSRAVPVPPAEDPAGVLAALRRRGPGGANGHAGNGHHVAEGAGAPGGQERA